MPKTHFEPNQKPSPYDEKNVSIIAAIPIPVKRANLKLFSEALVRHFLYSEA